MQELEDDDTLRLPVAKRSLFDQITPGRNSKAIRKHALIAEEDWGEVDHFLTSTLFPEAGSYCRYWMMS